MNTAALELDPRHQLARRNRPFVLAIAGRDEEAMAELAAQLVSNGRDIKTDLRMASLHAQLGRLDDARRILTNLSFDDVEDQTGFAVALARTGDLDRAFEAHSQRLLFFPLRVPGEIFRGDPRYEMFLDRMNFPQEARRIREP